MLVKSIVHDEMSCARIHCIHFTQDGSSSNNIVTFIAVPFYLRRYVRQSSEWKIQAQKSHCFIEAELDLKKSLLNSQIVKISGKQSYLMSCGLV